MVKNYTFYTKINTFYWERTCQLTSLCLYREHEILASESEYSKNLQILSSIYLFVPVYT